MLKNPPDGMPRISASVFYEDPAAAIDWLTKAFGFGTRLTIPDKEGNIMHAELTSADGMFMLGPTTWADWPKSPKAIGGANTQSLYVYVSDVDAHCQRARAAGAKILTEPEHQFYCDRTYRVEDGEGHKWTFAQHVRDIPPEEMEIPE